MKKKIVNIEGYILKKDFDKIPEISGIFFINILDNKNKVSEIIYIGNSSNIKYSIFNENVINNFFINNSNSKVAVSFTGIINFEEREIVYNNYLHYLRPKLNNLCLENFKPITLISLGETELINPIFTSKMVLV